MPNLHNPLLVFTDLDGSLLDIHTLDWQPAAPRLMRLREAQVPVILFSSKTAAEMTQLQKTLGLEGLPLIAENGAVIQLDTSWEADPHYPRLISGASGEDIQRILHKLREEGGYKFTCFAEAEDQAIADWTGVSRSQAGLAKLHIASETLIWRDDDAQMAAFSAALAQYGLRFMQGARFWHVLDQQAGKDKACRWLTEQYRQRERHDYTTLGLGDGPNDAPLLDCVDFAVVIRGLNRQGITLRDDRPQRVWHTTQEGPHGWSEGLDHFLGPL